MKKNKLVIFFVLTVFLLFFGCALEPELVKDFQETNICDFEAPPQGEIKIPEYQRFKFSNGLVLYLMEDSRFPIINFYAKLSVGTSQDPKEKIGLAQITTQLLRSGGTKSLSGDQIDDKLERVGAYISTSIGPDAAQISGQSLKVDFPEVFEIFAQILLEPVFSKDKLNLSRIQAMADIARRNDRAQDIASREFRRLVYGKNNPYAWITQPETISSIVQEDVVNFYQSNFSPEGMVLAIWGDFNKQEVFDKVETYFGDWARKDPVELPVFELDIKDQARSGFFLREGLTQSQIVMGHLGITRDDPDYFAVLVLSRVLGSGWNSRFMRYLRQEQALAYSIYASHAANFGYPGLFIAQAQTRVERTQEAIELMRQEIRRLSQEKVSSSELKIAKEGVLNYSLFWFDTPDKVIRRLVRYEYYGYPQDYIQKLLEGVKAVDAERLLEVAGRHLRSEQLSFFIVTTPKQKEELKDFLKQEMPTF